MIPARAFAVLLTLCLGSSALAQNPTENVTVTSQKGRDVPPERVLHDFIRSYTAPSPAIGKVARWRYGVCPAVTGLPPAWNKLVTTRVREIAGLAGAPVGADDCRANIDIVFTKNRRCCWTASAPKSLSCSAITIWPMRKISPA